MRQSAAREMRRARYRHRAGTTICSVGEGFWKFRPVVLCAVKGIEAVSILEGISFLGADDVTTLCLSIPETYLPHDGRR
jgi:hypothetical protein